MNTVTADAKALSSSEVSAIIAGTKNTRRSLLAAVNDQDLDKLTRLWRNFSHGPVARLKAVDPAQLGSEVQDTLNQFFLESMALAQTVEKMVAQQKYLKVKITNMQ